MTEKLTIFVCEFITGGGFCADALPENLVNEGKLMRDALFRDIHQLNAYHIISTHDVRLAPSALATKSIAVKAHGFDVAFCEALRLVDLVWLIAPETEGILLKYIQICEDANVRLIGCGYDACLIGTSKSLSYEALVAARINTLPVIAGDEFILDECFERSIAISAEYHQNEKKYWVAKLEDGAGCEGLRIFDDLYKLMDWLKEDNRYLNYLVQPYQDGISASLSILCREGKAWLLSANLQEMHREADTLKLVGITVNGTKNYWQRFETIARKIVKILPDAAAYLGVDVLIDTEHDQIMVLEINPRLTTSYVGLAEAIAFNPAELMINSVIAPNFRFPTIAKNCIQISI